MDTVGRDLLQPDALNKDRIDAYVAALKEKDVNMPCARCNHNRFRFIGESVLPTQQDLNTIVGVPVLVTACENCGWIANHAQEPLGLKLPEPPI